MRHYPCMTMHCLHTATHYLGKTTTPILHLVMVVTTSVLLLHPAPASGQSAGAIAGTVADAGGGALPGVIVTAAGPEGPREGVTGADGGFSFTGLPAGDYVVTAALPGFAASEAAVSVEAGATATVSLVLQIERLLETVSVIAEAPTIFASNVVAAPMLDQQAAITSVTAVVDNLPGVSVQEGDVYGFDDWSSQVAVRGFQTNINEAQIGTTIDGFPNGTSDYWSGSKANRFVDPANLGGVEVSQGTADIASRSVEALGGTFNFITDDPARERTYTASATLGEHAAERYYLRVDTGALFGRETYAWLSAGHQQATDWVQGSAQNERDHLAAKLVSSHGRLGLTSYFSHDDIQEDVYQRMYSAGNFEANPRWDRLIGDWPGVPYLNQFYRRGWRTRRKNTFGYLKADWSFSDVTTLSAGAYYHRQHGRGDWLPPYIVDVTDDGGGPESELAGGATVRGGANLGSIYFVDGSGAAVGPAAGCESSYIFNYYGSGGSHFDPACHPGATAVQSFRHSHYGKERLGLTLDEEWFTAHRRGRQHPAGRPLVRGLPAVPGPRLAPDARPEPGLPLGRQPLLAAVRLGFPADGPQVVHGGHRLRRPAVPLRGRQAVPGGRIAQRFVRRRVRPGDRLQLGPASSPAARPWRRRSTASICSPGTRRTSSRWPTASWRFPAGASTPLRRRPPTTSTSACAIPASGWPSA